MLQEAQQFAEEQGIFFIETSAKTGRNVNELFYEIGMSSTTLYIVYIYIAYIYILYIIYTVYILYILSINPNVLHIHLYMYIVACMYRRTGLYLYLYAYCIWIKYR